MPLRPGAIGVSLVLALATASVWPLPALARAAPARVDAAALYKARCQICHLANGDSKVKNMSFADGVWVHGSGVAEVAAVIRDGVKGTAMLPFKAKLTDAEIEALARHVRTFDKQLKAEIR